MKVYVKWNPLYERVVCVHENPIDTCSDCEKEEEIVKETAYFIEGQWFKIVPSTIPMNYCYCGKPVDTTNSDCIEFNLCEDHSDDA